MSERSKVIHGFMIVALIWSTTPLAIKWSGEGPGYAFGVIARMLIGLLCLLLVLYWRKASLPWHRQALQTYTAAAFGIYGTMLCVYWGSQYIPSGLVSVIFGLTPIITGVMAARVLGEDSVTLPKLVGSLLGLLGLVLIFGRGHTLGEMGMQGALAVFIAVVMQSISAVWVKRVHGDLSALSVTTGSMIVSMPFFILTWWLVDGQWPAQFTSRAIGSIIYLGSIATVIGFILYFYILKHMHASSVGLLNLISPVLALFVGYWLNDEVIGPGVWLGTVCILGGMSIYQWLRWPLSRKPSPETTKPEG